MRVTVISRMTQGLEAKLRARTARQKQRVLQTTEELAEEEYDIVQALVPRRTEFLANHTLLEFTRGGYNYLIGYRRGKFVGLVNPVTKKVVTRFYALDVIEGNSRQGGNDFLADARFHMRPRIRQRYKQALSG